MIMTNPRRYALRRMAWAGVFVSAVGLCGSTAQALTAGSPSSGSTIVTPAIGGRSTTFNLSFDPSATCPGDAVAGYRWSTFITPKTNDPAALTYSNSGNPQSPPNSTGFTGALRLASTGELINAENPGLSDGLIVVPLGLSFANVGFAALTPGDYWVGVACTKADSQGVVRTEKFWATHLVLTADASDTFTFVTVTPTSTTSTSSTTSTTTPTSGGTTTSTTAPTSTTSTSGGTTTTTGSTTTGFTPTTFVFTTLPLGGGSTQGGGGGGNGIATTGWSRVWMLVWGLLLLACGRMAVLLGRTPVVLPAVKR